MNYNGNQRGRFGSDWDDEENFAKDEILRDTAMVPGVVGPVFVVSLKPVVLFGDLNPGAIWNSPGPNFDYSLTYADFRVDWLDCDNDVVFLEWIEEPEGESINDDDVSRFDCGLHGDSVGVTDCYHILFDDVVSSDNWDNSQVGHYVLQHPILLLKLSLNSGSIVLCWQLKLP